MDMDIVCIVVIAVVYPCDFIYVVQTLTNLILYAMHININLEEQNSVKLI